MFCCSNVQFGNHLNTKHLNTGQYGYIQMVKSQELADHLNTGYFGPLTGRF